MIDRRWQGKRWRGVYAPAGVLVACGVLAAVGVAGAAQQAETKTVGVREDAPQQRFVDPTAVDPEGDPPVIAINTGDTITWDFTGSGQPHNAAEDESQPQPTADPTWEGYATPYSFVSLTTSRTFNYPGDYKFYCQAHPQMTGTISVTGDPVEPTPSPSPSASPTPSATASPTATPTPTPTPDTHTSTPPPTASASADTAAPALSAVKVKSLRRAARVTFKLSEAATVTLRVKKRAGRVVRTASLQARPGTRAVTVRSSRLKRGRYSVELQARDASGNRSPLVRSTFRIRR